MKANPKMWLAMRNYVKVLIILLIFFQVIAVIVTLERSKNDHSPSSKFLLTQKHDGTSDSIAKANSSFLNSTARAKSVDSTRSFIDKIQRFYHKKDVNNTVSVENNNYASHEVTMPSISIVNVSTMHNLHSHNKSLAITTVLPKESSESFPRKILSQISNMLDLDSENNEETTIPSSSNAMPNVTHVNEYVTKFKEEFQSTSEEYSDFGNLSGHVTSQDIVNEDVVHSMKFEHVRTTPSMYSGDAGMSIETDTTAIPTATLPTTRDILTPALDLLVESFTQTPAFDEEHKHITTTPKQSLLNSLIDTFNIFHARRTNRTSSTIKDKKNTHKVSKIKEVFRVSSEYDTAGMIRGAGYPVETHKVQTQDGYILTVYRIPATVPPTRPARRLWLPVYLQHGLWSSSYHWFETKPQYALPFIMSDAGYDVWLGNCRGNVISREHAYLSTDTNSSYWDFSFHEMGLYDLPATIDHILEKTNSSQLHYVGHSMGTTMFFVMASMRPDVASRVHFMLALAPIATVGPTRSFFRWMLLFERFILTREKPVDFLAENGISLKTVLHYMQLYVTGKFALYDYGKIANLDIYKSRVPPMYDLMSITIPIVLCYGTKDPFLRFEDLDTLSSSLGNALGMWPVPLSHFQFAGGRRSKEYLYQFVPLHLH